ncbi:TonB-dependent receptor domain-containing protein, partial [Serratia marcescens]|uniref:TonB-dependent receptor domain-containing protein n=1 Tax=Serratia marcescens TaxID=615 RepID=UPI002813409F
SFTGPVNFSLGANYLNFKIDEDYYVFNNIFTALARTAIGTGNLGQPVQDCTSLAYCAYVDPNPLSSINGQGHNYFRSRNLAKTESYAIFGEIYWKATDNLKFTAGLRFTDDKKTATPVPSQLLLAVSYYGGGLVNIGYPESPDIVQKWRR